MRLPADTSASTVVSPRSACSTCFLRCVENSWKAPIYPVLISFLCDCDAVVHLVLRSVGYKVQLDFCCRRESFDRYVRCHRCIWVNELRLRPSWVCRTNASQHPLFAPSRERPLCIAAQALVVEYIAPAPAACYAATASVGEYVGPICAVCAAPAPVVEHITSAPAVNYAAPAFVVEYVSPIRAVLAAPAPVMKYIAPATTPEARYATAAATAFAAPVPVVQYITPAPAVSYAAPRPTVLEAPAPVLEYLFQRQQ